MKKWPASWRVIFVLVLIGVASGCMPTSDGPMDDEKDANFVEGRNHQNAMDYKGAISAFERTIRANPNNAAAHFELGLLYEQKMGDFVTAAYHYQRHLQLKPKSEHADVVNQHITTCKMELAKTVTYGVITREMHQDLQRLTNDIANLRRENDQLKMQLAAKPTILTQWNTVRTTQFVTLTVTNTLQARPPTNYVAQPQQAVRQPTQTPTPQNRPATNPVTRVQTPVQPTKPAARVYSVRAGDTMGSIARRYGVSVERLRAANPTVQRDRIHPAQNLTIPAE